MPYKNKEDAHEWGVKYYKKHKRKRSIYSKNYYKLHKDKIRKQSNEWYNINKDGIKDKRREYGKKYNATHKKERSIYNRNYRIKKSYGISQIEYEKKYSKLNGCCEICGKKFKILHIDHNHETGKFRGLLCYRHNYMLGFAGDSIDVLKRAINYLERRCE